MELAGTGGYAPMDGAAQELGLALLPGISLAAQQEIGIIESATVGSGVDSLAWHVLKIRERQGDVSRVEGEVRTRVQRLLRDAEQGGGGDRSAGNGDGGQCEDDHGTGAPYQFGPSRQTLALRHYRATPAPKGLDDDDREGRQRKRKSRWETDGGDAAGPGSLGTTGTAKPGSALAHGGAAAMKAHLAGIASKFGVRSGPVNGPFHGFTQGIGAADGGPTPADSDDPEVVARYLRFVEASRKLDERDFTDNRHTRERSPSPPPKYDNRGARVNTREWRMEQKLKETRNDLAGWLVARCPHLFRPPQDWRPTKKKRKIFVPEKEHPGYNFIGLIIGPRGNTQKRMQRETNTRIAIRGKGCIKGNANREPNTDYAEDEDLHVVITGDTDEEVDRAETMLMQLLKPVDETFNEHKRAQLRELALINGTLRDVEGLLCHGCGRPGHSVDTCPDKDGGSFRADVALVTCKICGDGGHPTIDCPLRNNPGAAKGAQAEMSSEYQSFLSELGVDKVPGVGNPSSGGPGVGFGSGRTQGDRSVDQTKVYVGSLAEHIEDGLLRAIFENCGPIETAKVVRNPDMTPRGFGFVKFSDAESAQRAVASMHGAQVEGRRLKVNVAGEKAAAATWDFKATTRPPYMASGSHFGVGAPPGPPGMGAPPQGMGAPHGGMGMLHGGGFMPPPPPPGNLGGFAPPPPPVMGMGVNVPPPPPFGMGGGGHVGQMGQGHMGQMNAPPVQMGYPQMQTGGYPPNLNVPPPPPAMGGGGFPNVPPPPPTDGSAGVPPPGWGHQPVPPPPPQFAHSNVPPPPPVSIGDVPPPPPPSETQGDVPPPPPDGNQAAEYERFMQELGK